MRLRGRSRGTVFILERAIKPKNLKKKDEIKTTMQMYKLICSTSASSQTLEEAMKAGRVLVIDSHLKVEDELNRVILMEEEKAFYDHIEQEFETVAEEYETSAKTSYMKNLNVGSKII